MATSKMTQIDKAMGRARARTKAEVAQKLARGLPIATAENGVMELQQIQDDPGLRFVTADVKSKLVSAPLARAASRYRRPLKSRLAVEDSASRAAELTR